MWLNSLSLSLSLSPPPPSPSLSLLFFAAAASVFLFVVVLVVVGLFLLAFCLSLFSSDCRRAIPDCRLSTVQRPWTEAVATVRSSPCELLTPSQVSRFGVRGCGIPNDSVHLHKSCRVRASLVGVGFSPRPIYSSDFKICWAPGVIGSALGLRRPDGLYWEMR